MDSTRLTDYCFLNQNGLFCDLFGVHHVIVKDIWSIAKVQHVCHFTIAIGFQSVFCNATVYFVSPFSGMEKKKKLFTGRRKKEKVCTLELTENIVYLFFFLINTSLMKFRSSLCWAL